MREVERVKQQDIRLVPDTDEEVRQLPVTPQLKRRKPNTKHLHVQPRRERSIHFWERQARERSWADLEAAIYRWRPITLGNQRRSQESEARRRYERDLQRVKDAIEGKGQEVKDIASRIADIGDKIQGMGNRMRKHPDAKSRRRLSFDELHDFSAASSRRESLQGNASHG